MKAVGYVRVSSTDQIAGTSLENQERQIRAYCEMKMIELVSVVVDAGVSGGKSLSRRPEGSKLVAMLEARQADCVVMCKLDRGFRSASDCLTMVENWESSGTALHILNLGGQTIDTASPTGKFFITVMAGAAELERNLIRERCNEGRRARKREGKRIGEVPFGWTVNKSTKDLVVNTQEQGILHLIEELRGNGSTIRQVAAELNRRGIQSKKGKLWSHTQVHRLVQRMKEAA